MSEAHMQKILALETDPRNHAMLRLMYNAGLRVSEVINLTWLDVKENEQVMRGSVSQRWSFQ